MGKKIAKKAPHDKKRPLPQGLRHSKKALTQRQGSKKGIFLFSRGGGEGIYTLAPSPAGAHGNMIKPF